MTMLSQYMRAERVDTTEPVSFYAPGATAWGDPSYRAGRELVYEGEADDLPPALHHETDDQEPEQES